VVRHDWKAESTGLSLRNWDRPAEGLREEQDIPTQEEASGKEGDTWRAQRGAQ